MCKLSKSNIKRVRMLLKSYEARYGAFVDPNTGVVFFDPKDPRDNTNSAWARAIRMCRWVTKEDLLEVPCDLLSARTQQNYYERKCELPVRSEARRRWREATKTYRARRISYFARVNDNI